MYYAGSREKHPINARIEGEGAETLIQLITDSYPEAEVFYGDYVPVEWKAAAIVQEIKGKKTPGKLLGAYRERTGLTLAELAKAVGTKYSNISAMEHDRRVIGLNSAKRLGAALSSLHVVSGFSWEVGIKYTN